MIDLPVLALNIINKFRFFIIFILVIFFYFSNVSYADTYNLSNGDRPPCNTSWSVSGTTYICTGNGRVTLASGDVLTSNTTITISANNGFVLSNNIIGSLANNINLVSSYGAIQSGNTNTVYGSITSGSGAITLINTTVTGTITTGGNINLTGGSVAGKITSNSNTITTNGTNLSGGAQAQSGMNFTGGTLAGSFVMTSNNPITLTGVTMTSGSISGASTATIQGGSLLGSSSSAITISSNSGAINVNNSTVYGDLTAPGYSTVNITNGGAVYGSCTPNATPANACTPASTILGSWRMDEPYWNGTPNEVKDSSGNNNHGRARIANGSTPTASTALVTPAFINNNQSTCSYGQFDNTTAPIRTYTYLELSGFPALPTSFTFTAWIRSTNPSAQHQRILVRDDAQNGWGLSLADGTGQPRLRFFNRNIQNNGAATGQGNNPNCGVFCLDTNSVITANAWHFIAATIDTSVRRVTLYVYNQSGTLLARTSAAYSGTWQDGSGTAAIGGETLASAEGRQSSFHFLGNIDEVEIYTGALSQSYIESLRTRVRVCPLIAPHHYELQVPSNSIACMASPVTVVACADNSSPCSNSFLAAGGTTASLSTTAGALANTTVTFNNGGFATTTLSYPGAINGAGATVTLSNEQIAGLNGRQCCRDGVCTFSNSCATTFNSAGLVFATTTALNSQLLPNQVAGVTGSTPVLRAVRTNTTTGACEARVTGTRAVQLAYECTNPAACVSGQTLTLNNNQIQANNSGTATTYVSRNLTFDSNGNAAIPINYSDVGRILLRARLNIAASGAEPAYTFTGVSNQFVVKPFTLAVSAVPGNTETTESGNGFLAAGELFTVQVEARNASGARTPNFGKEISQSEHTAVAINLTEVTYPSGGQLGDFSQAGEFTLTSTPGLIQNETLRWSDVGTIKLQPTLGDNDYLGAGDLSVLTTSSNIGRFYPSHFVMSASNVENECSNFTYMGQQFPFNYRLEARNKMDALTVNYNSPAYLTPASIQLVAENANDGVNLSDRVSAAMASWINGVVELSVENRTAQFLRQASTAPDGPFASLQLGLMVQDELDSRLLQALDMDPDSDTNCSGVTCKAKALGVPLKLRYGRLRLDDAFGPESADLPVNFSTEYWLGNRFIKNLDDSCTKILRSAITYPAGNILTPANSTVSLNGGSTVGNYGSSTTEEINFISGNANHFFSAPGVGATGRFDVKVDLTSYPWLRFDWNQDGDFSDAALPDAEFGFGTYRGHDRIIYWRERFQ